MTEESGADLMGSQVAGHLGRLAHGRDAAREDGTGFIVDGVEVDRSIRPKPSEVQLVDEVMSRVGDRVSTAYPRRTELLTHKIDRAMDSTSSRV